MVPTESCGPTRGYFVFTPDKCGEGTFDSAPRPRAGDVLNPAVFREMRHSLGFKPSADTFASATHHQLPRYYSRHPADVASAGVDAFSFDWKCDGAPYFNPPWSLIHAILCTIASDQVRGMVVVHE